MDAVRDVGDRHLLGGRRPVERAPHLARHLAVAKADGIRTPGEPERERRHPRPLVAVGVGAAEGEEPVGIDPEPSRDVRERLDERSGLVRLVARRHRGVRGEHAALSRGRQRVVDRLAGGDAARRQLEGGERGVPLVEVEDAGLDPERLEDAHGADAEQAVLAEARERVALVEAGRDPPVDGVVLVELGVEEVQRHATDLGAPHVERDLAAEERERQPEGRAVGARHLDGRQVLGDDLRPVLVLEPAAVDALLEVPLAVQEPDADHRDAEVARLLEDVAGERAQATRVDGQRRMDPELGADEDDRPVDAVHRPLGTRAILLEDARQTLDALPRRRVARRGVGGVRREVLELAHRVPAVDLPGMRVERPEQLRPVRVPRPAVVERDPGQRRQLRGEPPGEPRGALVRLAGARQGCDVDDPCGAHGRPR